MTDKKEDYYLIKKGFEDYIGSCKNNCYCTLRQKCENCIGKEHILELWKTIEKDIKDNR